MRAVGERRTKLDDIFYAARGAAVVGSAQAARARGIFAATAIATAATATCIWHSVQTSTPATVFV